MENQFDVDSWLSRRIQAAQRRLLRGEIDEAEYGRALARIWQTHDHMVEYAPTMEQNLGIVLEPSAEEGSRRVA